MDYEDDADEANTRRYKLRTALSQILEVVQDAITLASDHKVDLDLVTALPHVVAEQAARVTMEAWVAYLSDRMDARNMLIRMAALRFIEREEITHAADALEPEAQWELVRAHHTCASLCLAPETARRLTDLGLLEPFTPGGPATNLTKLGRAVRAELISFIPANQPDQETTP